MTNDKEPYTIAEIHELLIAAFTAKSLRRFCYQRPAFRPILDEFAPDHGLADMVDQLVEHCEKNVLSDELLAEVKGANPRHQCDDGRCRVSSGRWLARQRLCWW